MATLQQLVNEHGFGIKVNIYTSPPFTVVKESTNAQFICNGPTVGNFELNKESCPDFNLVEK